MPGSGVPAASPLAVALAAATGVAEQLLAAHRDDGTGHCRLCSSGAGAGRKAWPCSLHAAAEAAVALRERS